MTGHERGSAAYRRMLVALLFAGVATFAQLYSFQAVLTLVQADLGVSPAQAALTVSAATGGLAFSVVPWSAISDRYGRRRSMIAALITATVLSFVSILMPSLPLVVLLRFLEGAALGGIPATAMAYIAEEVHAGHAAVAAGTFISGNTLGGLSGRLLGAPMGEMFGWRGGVSCVTLMAAVATALFIIAAPKQRGFEPTPIRLGPLTGRLLATLQDKRLLVLYLQAFLLMGAFVAMYNYLGFHLGQPPFNLSPGWASLLFLAYLAGTWSSSAAARLGARLGRRRILLASGVVMAVGAVLTIVPSLVVVILGLLLYTAGFFGAHSTANAWAPALAKEHAAQASSFYILGYYAGSSIVGYLAGLVYAGSTWLITIGFLCALVFVAMATARIALPEN